MPSYYGPRLDRAWAVLRRELPLPVRLRVVAPSALTRYHEGEEVYGDYRTFGDGKNRRGEIRLARGLGVDLAVMILLHEIAHCLHDSPSVNVRDWHRASWGAAYSTIYRRWLQTLEE